MPEFNLQDSIRTVLNGNSVLVVGAGFSVLAKNIDLRSPRSSGELTSHLYAKCSTESDGKLANAVEEFREQHGEHALIELLKEEYTVVDVAEDQIEITSLPWKRVYTTNYDNVLELCFRRNKRLLTPVTLSDNPHNYKDKSKLCIHLNGYIERLTPDTLQNEFKLTDVSYLSIDFTSSEWITLFRADMRNSDCIVFIGFSLEYDLDLKRILSDTKDFQSKAIFIHRKEEKSSILRNTKRFGHTLPIGLETYAERVKVVKSDYVPEVKEIPSIFSFLKVEIVDDIPELKDVHTIDLFFQGNIKQEYVQLSLSNPEKYEYFIKREKLTSTFEAIKGGQKHVLVHSDLGNGKTVFINGLAYLLKGAGYTPFIYERSFENIELEIEAICTRFPKPVIFLESYSSHFDILQQIQLYKTSETVVIVTERTFINDTVYLTLQDEYFNEGDYTTVDLNQLTTAEIRNIIRLFSNYGFWGDLARKGDWEKESFIVDKCRRSLRLLLLQILKSPDIQNRFRSILDSIHNKRAFYNAILLILASNIFDFRLELDELIYIFDDEILGNPSFANNPNLKEMISFDRYQISVRSSILSEAILTNIENQKPFIDSLVKTAEKLDKRRYDSNNYQILKSIVSFTRLQRVLNRSAANYEEILISFFEQVKNLQFNKRNPHFWLQYAIARLSIQDYPNADRYFQTAYSFADPKTGYDTYKIDNHYARHLLENEIYYGNQQSCMAQFVKAHALITKPNSHSERHYPIRVAFNYIRFHDNYFNGMTEPEKVVFVRSCREIVYKIEEYNLSTEQYKRLKEVEMCYSGLNRILLQHMDIVRLL